MSHRAPQKPAPARPAPGKTASPSSHRGVARNQPDPEKLMRTCPTCGSTLAERKCKLYCPDPRCGYYLSCADYY